MKNLLKYILSLCICYLISLNYAFAQSSIYTIEFKDQNNQAVAGVRIDGNHGIHELAGKTSGTDGIWEVDLREVSNLSESNPNLYFTRTGYRFEPAEIELKLENCPDYNCAIRAVPSVNETSLIRLNFKLNANMIPKNVEVSVLGSDNACSNFTDSFGDAYFTTNKKLEACNDTDNNSNNDNNRIIVRSPAGLNCTFTGLPRTVCARNLINNFYITASCTAMSNSTANQANGYLIELKNEKGLAIDLAGLSIIPNNPQVNSFASQSDYNGRAFINFSQIGGNANSTFKLIPFGLYDFLPKELEVNKTNCPMGICKITGISNNFGQDVAKVIIQNQNLSGLPAVDLTLKDPKSCNQDRSYISNSKGEILFPIKRQRDCQNAANKTSFKADKLGCSFSQNSDQGFEICNTQSPTTRYLTASCEDLEKNYKVSGKIYGPNGEPFERIALSINGETLATSDADGKYSFEASRNSSLKIQPVFEDYIFDPAEINIVEIDQDHNLNYYALAADGREPEGRSGNNCLEQESYLISGKVSNSEGNALEGVAIYNNHSQATSTDSEGEYQITVVKNSSNWITAELNDQEFNPAGFSLPVIDCDEGNVNFQLQTERNYNIGGKAKTSQGLDITGMKLNLRIDDVDQELLTDELGLFQKTIVEDANFEIKDNDPNYICSPSQYQGTVTGNSINYNFSCIQDLCPQDNSKIAPGICGCGVEDLDTDSDGTYDCQDGCKTDSQKTAPGICGCGIPDEDLDLDGVKDCVDNCPRDSQKSEPGVCGCGVVEHVGDGDGDGVAECNDECRNDPLKSKPGQCGCGTADTDSDGDAIADCRDLCPNNPSKIAPGVCGCSRPDSDTDGDGKLDCQETCSTDPRKFEPGICGCGVRDIDTDLDGTLDCKDFCPNDPNKINPGVCGCGALDRDSDSDGKLDCEEECPFDPLKITKGICGCNISDIDSDADGIPDCKDTCKNDPLKTNPGFCGCGNTEIDTDEDGYSDCFDSCPDDPNKYYPGICGCGNPDTDNDGDQIPNCIDACPNDPNKVSAGACGCGTSDTDTDKDGILDCFELCDDDRNKTVPGICGCNIPDQDSDQDQLMDCQDECPFDSKKIKEGICGCNVPDTDSDGDGRADCKDRCPNDKLKTEIGVCGCGTPDTDNDKDGTADCIDLCPQDVKKTKPGVCGCGSADTDEDQDGTADCKDLCPTDPKKITPGTCGCNEQDSDKDGTPDCLDQCPTDPKKVQPGTCGCNEKDSDLDGVPDCLDSCPSDKNKTSAGACGCGNPDLDADQDGHFVCNEQCDQDPNKTAPGVCGCGIADQDNDNDGTPDCKDQCPQDRNKLAPGLCGCSVSDSNSDGDSKPDCLDQCPLDSSKIYRGYCGCGYPETDNDQDGIPNCADSCPSDPLKNRPGSCGCGVRDVDSDKDGAADCIDGCPNDKNKKDVGICGCGVAETDTDRDGTPDCTDGCPNNPSKIEPGACGCNMSDSDNNKNGEADCREKNLDFEALCIEDETPVPNEPVAVDLCASGASEVKNYLPGKGVDLNPQPDLNRQDLNNALGVPERDETLNFVSLGRGGKIELAFNGNFIENKSGPDFMIAETSWGQAGKPCSTYPEQAEIFVTADGHTWHSLGNACRDGYFDLADANLERAIAVRVVDKTSMKNSDGYDLDGIYCVKEENLPTPEPSPSLSPTPTLTPSPSPNPSLSPNPSPIFSPSPAPTLSPPPSGSPIPSPVPDDGDENDDDEWECDNGIGASAKCEEEDDNRDKVNKVVICHIPPGNAENSHTLEVAKNAVAAHLAHGDSLGACEERDSLNFSQAVKTGATEDLSWKVNNPNSIVHAIAFKQRREDPIPDLYFTIAPGEEMIFKTPLLQGENTLIMFVDEEEKDFVTHPKTHCHEPIPTTHKITVKLEDQFGNAIDRRVILGNQGPNGPDEYGEQQTGSDGQADWLNMPSNMEYSVYVDKGCEYSVAPEFITGKLTADVEHKFIINQERTLSPLHVCGTVLHKGLPLSEVKIDAGKFGKELTNVSGNWYYENIKINSEFTYFSEKPGFSFQFEPNTLTIDQNRTIRYRATRSNLSINPEEYTWIGGEIKYGNGRREMTPKIRKRLGANRILINGRNDSKGEKFNINLAEPFDWLRAFEKGHNARIAAKGDFEIASKPLTYRRKINDTVRGFHFTIRPRGTEFAQKIQQQARIKRSKLND